MADNSKMKLGRKAIKTDSRTLRLAKYLTPALPDPPPSVDWTKGITDWGMMLNDKLGDCTIAGLGHAIQVWTANTGSEFTPSDDMIESAYEDWDGYVPGNPDTDQGGVELDVLNKWKKLGFGGHSLLAFADPRVSNITEIRQSIALFGGVYIGINLPISAQNQDVWRVVFDPGDGSAKPGSWGGHAVFVPAYDQNGFTCITWGQLKKMTWNFWDKYVDESHVLLNQDWLANGKSASGFDLAQLQADLAAIR